MKKSLAVAVLGVFAVASVAIAGVKTNRECAFQVYGIAEQFKWAEYDNGQEILKESGPLFGLGGEFELTLWDSLLFEGYGEIFRGDVDYDGAILTDQGNQIPYSTTTEYVGFKIEGNVAISLLIDPDKYIKPYCGLGLRKWTRTLDAGKSNEAGRDWGYEEDWFTAYGIVGCRGGIAVGENSECFLLVEGRVAFHNSMTVDLTRQGGPSDIELEPGCRPSLYVEGGLNHAYLTASIFVETLEFSESSLDDEYQAVFQPESKSTMIGIKLGAAF